MSDTAEYGIRWGNGDVTAIGTFRNAAKAMKNARDWFTYAGGQPLETRAECIVRRWGATEAWHSFSPDREELFTLFHPEEA